MGTFLSFIFWVLILYAIARKILQELGKQTGNPNIVKMAKNPFKELMNKVMHNANIKTASYTDMSNNKFINMNNMKGKIFGAVVAFIAIIILMNIFIIIQVQNKFRIFLQNLFVEK